MFENQMNQNRKYIKNTGMSADICKPYELICKCREEK